METSPPRLDQRLFEPTRFDMTRDMTRTIWHPAGHLSMQPRMRQYKLTLPLGVTRIARQGVALAAGLIALGVISISDGPPAHAGDVEGKIVFKPKLGEPPVRNQGFIKRIANPQRPVRSFNPRPYMIAVLDGGEVDDEAKKPPGGRIRYYLEGQSFNRVILPVIVNTRVELVNSTGSEATLFTPDSPVIADGHTLNPRGMHDFKVTEAGSVIVIRSQDENHIEGRVVALPHRYFAPIDRRGKFEIKDVPEGQWTVKVWYRDGWLDGVSASVTVDKRRGGEVDVTISPDKVKTGK